MSQNSQKILRLTKKNPAWVPAGGGEGFSTRVIGGVEGGHDGMDAKPGPSSGESKAKFKSMTADQLVKGILSGDRMVLAKAITLIESNAKRHLKQAQIVLEHILPHAGNSIRIGITGVPGAGKSTFIDAFGIMLCEKGYKVAVLAVDPSSTISKGSILGDKTRMERLGQQLNCFIRPSSSGGTLGGVNRKTRETILVCEAAGYDVILIETVGVGQSEALVYTMVDFFLLLAITGAGDELQNIKKGVVEMADAIAINKADGANKSAAVRAMQEFNRALYYLKPTKTDWKTEACCCSALNGEGIESVWQTIQTFNSQMKSNGEFFKNRQQQSLDWMHDMLLEEIRSLFYQHPSIASRVSDLEYRVGSGQMPVTKAVGELIHLFDPS